MLKNREIRKSLKDRITALLQTNYTEAGWSGTWNIYNEADFRAVAKNGKVTAGYAPVFPFVYVLDSFLQPVEGVAIDLMQPQVVVEIDQYRTLPFELGNRKGRMIKALVHIFGKNRGERDDLASYFMDYLGSALPINTYSANAPEGVKVEDALIDPDMAVTDMYTPRLDVLTSNVLLGWSTLEFKFQTKL